MANPDPPSWSNPINSVSPTAVLVCPLTSTLVDAPFHRVTVEPSAVNGLSTLSQVMADKMLAVRRDKCGARIGALDAERVAELDRTLALVIGLADRPPARPGP